MRKVIMLLLVVTFAITPLFGKVNGVDANDSGHISIQEDGDVLPIVSDGQAQSVVVIAEDADEGTRKSANILVEYVQKSTGVTLPVMTERDIEEENLDKQGRIYIGESDFIEDERIDEGLEDLDRHGFLIHPHGNHLMIVGPTVWGTRNGVYDFLERYVGVRWLMPGEAWEHVPQRSDLVVPREKIREEPDVKYRTMNMGGSGNEYRQVRSEWQERNRIQSGATRQLEMTHNLHTLFPPEKYGETHPEFYPQGQPPAPGVTRGWQPCFTEPGTIDAAVSGIIEYFEENPEAESFSLSPNDGDGGKAYCEEYPDHPHYPNKFNSVGAVDLSDIYYAWVNEVVERVLDVYPDKTFGVYAYVNTFDPPSFPVHPSAVVVLAKDRLSWIDEEVRESGHQHMEAWSEVASQLGWYDYMYGYSYLVPRVYPRLMAENFQYAKEHNVILRHADMHQTLGDGPKPWISAKLQWHSDQDIETLLSEWYETAVGPEAAADLAAYYDLWEHFWTERIKESNWFALSKDKTYLSFNNPSYLNVVTEVDINESRRLLESVVAKAETTEQRTRAKLMLRQFEYYEASALSYPREIDPPDNEAAALSILENVAGALDSRLDLVQTRGDLLESFEDELSLKYPNKPRPTWTGWNPYEFWHLMDYIKEHEPAGGAVTNQVKELAQNPESAKLREFARLLLDADMASSLTENPSFEEGNEEAPPWNFWNPEGTANIQRVEGTAHTGNGSVLFENTKLGGTYQTLAIQPGLVASRVDYYTPPGTETEGAITLVIEAFNTPGDKLVYQTNPVALSDTAGEWASIGFLEEIPETVNQKAVSEILVNAQVHNAQDAQVYQDNFVVYQYAPFSTDLKALVERFEDEGAFESQHAPHILKIHLTAVERFEKQGVAEKVVKHMESFTRLLDHQKDRKWISEQAYNALKEDAESVIKQWE